MHRADIRTSRHLKIPWNKIKEEKLHILFFKAYSEWVLRERHFTGNAGFCLRFKHKNIVYVIQGK